MVADMKAAGIEPAIIFVFEKTGRLGTADKRSGAPSLDRDRSFAANTEAKDFIRLKRH